MRDFLLLERSKGKRSPSMCWGLLAGREASSDYGALLAGRLIFLDPQ